MVTKQCINFKFVKMKKKYSNVKSITRKLKKQCDK